MKKLDSLEKEKKSTWGGKREKSGRKPLLGREELEEIKELISVHGSAIDEKSKKQRLIVLLDKLYELGKTGNVIAIKEYLDRQLGKSKDSLDVTTQGEKLDGLDEKQIERIARRFLNGVESGEESPDRLPDSHKS